MKYYIYSPKEMSYELSEHESREEAETKMSHMHKKKREKSRVVGIPEIKKGLKLFVDNNYYQTIVEVGDNLYYTLKDIHNEDDILNPIIKDHLIEWFLYGRLDSDREEYNEEIVDRKIGD